MDFEKAKQYAARLIKCRPRSQVELQDKLKKKGCSCEVVEKLVSEFKEKGLLNDRSFARLWARSRSHAAPKGIALIKSELASKEVDEGVVDEAIEELKKEYNEEDAARHLLNKRLRLVAGLDKAKQKSRLYGYLKRRGFSNEVIYKLLGEVL